MSAVRRNDFEMIWGGKIIRVRNRIKAKKGGKKIPNSNKQGQEESKMA